jgi:hypothetical protein
MTAHLPTSEFRRNGFDRGAAMRIARPLQWDRSHHPQQPSPATITGNHQPATITGNHCP